MIPIPGPWSFRLMIYSLALAASAFLTGPFQKELSMLGISISGTFVALFLIFMILVFIKATQGGSNSASTNRRIHASEYQ